MTDGNFILCVFLCCVSSVQQSNLLNVMAVSEGIRWEVDKRPQNNLTEGFPGGLILALLVVYPEGTRHHFQPMKWMQTASHYCYIKLLMHPDPKWYLVPPDGTKWWYLPSQTWVWPDVREQRLFWSLWGSAPLILCPCMCARCSCSIEECQESLCLEVSRLRQSLLSTGLISLSSTFLIYLFSLNLQGHSKRVRGQTICLYIKKER